MNDNKNALLQSYVYENEQINFEALEDQLESELEEQMEDLEFLKEDREKISNPESLGTTVMNIVWEQFVNQVGVIAGEDFIKENRGLKLDLSKDAHIQTTDNFAKGKIATHNTKIDYQQRYDDWQSKLEHNPDGTVKTHHTRGGNEVANVKKDARAPFDNGRPKGSYAKGTDMDHTIAAAEIIRDPAANAHLTLEEQVTFANSEKNLNEINANANRSKKDTPMTEWLDNPNSSGIKPSENPDFGITEEVDKQLREKDREARAEYESLKKRGEQRSIEAGKQSRREEAFRIGGKAIRAAIMGIIAAFVKKIAQELIAWLKTKEKSLETFIFYIKEAIHEFVKDIKETLITAVDTVATAIATAIIGPVVSIIKKAWIFLKQGYKSLKEAILYIKDKKNKNKPFSILMLEVGKIIMAGLTASGAIFLGELIEKGLITIPIFAVQIPLLGSLANILGIFFGALIAGIIGAIALSIIDKAIAKKQIKLNAQQQFDKKNEILKTQGELIVATANNMSRVKTEVYDSMKQRHLTMAKSIKESVESIMNNDAEIVCKNDEALNDLLDDINKL